MGYRPKSETIELQTTYFSNCLTKLELCEGKPINHYVVYPTDFELALDPIDNEY